jgi:hypothetical protein
MASRMRWGGNAVHIVVNHEDKTPHGKIMCRWEDDIK